jgi:hypothetical protein
LCVTSAPVVTTAGRGHYCCPRSLLLPAVATAARGHYCPPSLLLPAVTYCCPRLGAAPRCPCACGPRFPCSTPCGPRRKTGSPDSHASGTRATHGMHVLVHIGGGGSPVTRKQGGGKGVPSAWRTGKQRSLDTGWQAEGHTSPPLPHLPRHSSHTPFLQPGLWATGSTPRRQPRPTPQPEGVAAGRSRSAFAAAPDTTGEWHIGDPQSWVATSSNAKPTQSQRYVRADCPAPTRAPLPTGPQIRSVSFSRNAVGLGALVVGAARPGSRCLCSGPRHAPCRGTCCKCVLYVGLGSCGVPVCTSG